MMMPETEMSAGSSRASGTDKCASSQVKAPMGCPSANIRTTAEKVIIGLGLWVSNF